MIEYKVTVGDDGSQKWTINDELHREDGPAYISGDGNHREWFRHGKLHHEIYPAIVTPEYQSWFHHGVLHRLHGPAIVYLSGRKEYWIDGVEYIGEEYNVALARRNAKPSCIGKIIDIDGVKYKLIEA